MRRRDLERVGRIVVGQHDAVAVEDEAAVGHDRHDRDAVVLGLRRVARRAGRPAGRRSARRAGRTRRARTAPPRPAGACGSARARARCCAVRSWPRRAPRRSHCSERRRHSGRFSSGSGARRCGASSSTVTTGHSSASNTRREQQRPSPGSMPPAIKRTTSDDRVRGEEQRQDLHRLRRHREPEQAPVDRDREEAEHV